MTDQNPATRPRARIPMALIAIVIVVGLGFMGVYEIGGFIRNASGDPTCRPAVDLATKIKPLAHGEVAALTMATEPLRVPDLVFDDADGKPRKLSEFRGH